MEVRVALDAVGGDFAPDEALRGAAEALRRDAQLWIDAVGPRELLTAKARQLWQEEAFPIERLAFVDAQGPVPEGERPSFALRSKPSAAVFVATRRVAEGQADAVVSAGNSGACMVAAAHLLGMLPGVRRAGVMLCFFEPTATFLTDPGPNIDCTPLQLLQYGWMASTYVESFLGVDRPRVALLSVGAEKGKGNALVKEATALFERSDLHFIGNIEGHDLVHGKADVVVTDGFVGNALLKFMEGFGDYLNAQFGVELSNQLSALQLEKLQQGLWRLTHPVERGDGTPVLGVNGLMVMAHGASRGPAFTTALQTAARAKRGHFLERMKAALTRSSVLAYTDAGQDSHKV